MFIKLKFATNTKAVQIAMPFQNQNRKVICKKEMNSKLSKAVVCAVIELCVKTHSNNAACISSVTKQSRMLNELCL